MRTNSSIDKVLYLYLVSPRLTRDVLGMGVSRLASIKDNNDIRTSSVNSAMRLECGTTSEKELIDQPLQADLEFDKAKLLPRHHLPYRKCKMVP
jgi:hypothetical protein